MALRPQGSDKAHGLTHSSDTQAVWEGQSESFVQPISAATKNVFIFRFNSFSGKGYRPILFLFNAYASENMPLCGDISS